MLIVTLSSKCGGRRFINPGFCVSRTTKKKDKWKEGETRESCTFVLAPAGRLVPAVRGTVKQEAEWSNKWDETA